MIGLILIYFIGKAFYDLAELHNKSKWGFAILGIVSYYAGTFIGGLIIGIMAELYSFSIDNTSNIVLGLMTLPLGILTCWATYKILQKQWRKSFATNDKNILDGDLIKQNTMNREN